MTANFAGTGIDAIGEIAYSPDGRPDFNIKVSGLQSLPREIEILSDTGGIWEYPFKMMGNRGQRRRDERKYGQAA